MIKLYNFDELKPEEILNRDIRAEKNVEDVAVSYTHLFRVERPISSPAAACRWAAGKRPIPPTPSSSTPSPVRK